MLYAMEDPDYPRVVSPFSKGPITQFVLEGKQMKSPDIPENIRAMYNGGRGKENDEAGDFAINPDPVPYQPSNFIPNRKDKLDFEDTLGLSSTVLKKVPVPRRHLDTFGGLDFSSGSQRPVVLHTDRYQWDSRAFDGLSQRERLEAELEYMERLRGIKRRREVLPHRAQLDLLMGGKKIDFTERFDIQREIQKLRSLILPQNARDLFHGRGFTLPQGHNSLQPRRILPPDIDLEENEITPSSKHSLDPETGRSRPRWQKQGDASSTTFPKINSRGHMLDNFRVARGSPIPVKTPNPFDMIQEDTWTPFVSRQPTMMSPGNRSPAVPFSPRRRHYRENTQDSRESLFFLPATTGVVLSPKGGYGTGLGGSRGFVNYD